MSPGFIETSDVRLAEMKTMLTLGYDGVHPGFFDACYAFDAKLVQGLGGFDETIVEWYDIDWYLRLLKFGVKPVVSDKVTIQHHKAHTRRREEFNPRDIRNEIIAKHWQWFPWNVRFAILCREFFRWAFILLREPKIFMKAWMMLRERKDSILHRRRQTKHLVPYKNVSRFFS